MHRFNFSFSELESKIQQIKSTEKKIEFISQKIWEGNHFILNIRQAISVMKIDEVAISTNLPNIQLWLNDLLRGDDILRNQLVKVQTNILDERLCIETEIFVKQAKNLLKHHLCTFKIMTKSYALKECIKQAEKVFPEAPRILWKAGKEKLLLLIELLISKEMLTGYSQNEMLAVFKDENHKLFTKERFEIKHKLIWQKSDGLFGIMIDELAKLGAVPEENKYQIFCEHFLNRNSKDFTNLRQKRNYTDTTTIKGEMLRGQIRKIWK